MLQHRQSQPAKPKHVMIDDVAGLIRLMLSRPVLHFLFFRYLALRQDLEHMKAMAGGA
jgi:hypothetical protein